jgi:hypothetical protein
MRRLARRVAGRLGSSSSKEGNEAAQLAGASDPTGEVLLTMAPPAHTEQPGQLVGGVELGGETQSRTTAAVDTVEAMAHLQQRVAEAEDNLVAAEQHATAATAETIASQAILRAEIELLRAQSERLLAENARLRQEREAAPQLHVAPPASAAAPGARTTSLSGALEIGAWTLVAWLRSLDLASIATTAFAPPTAQHDEFSYVRALSDTEAEAKLSAAGLQGLVPVVVAALARLREQNVATGSELNSKFAADGSIAMKYGEMDVFEAGIEGFIGPPLVRAESEALQAVSTAIRGNAPAGPTLLGQMELEHCCSPDSEVPFPSQIGREVVKPRAQWAFVTKEPAAGYHPDTECAKTGSRPIYGVRYVLDSKGMSLCASAYEKLVKKLDANEMGAVQLMNEAGLTTDELSQFRRIDLGEADPDDDGTFGIGGRCRPGLAHFWRLALGTNTELEAQHGAPLTIEEVLAVTLCTRMRGVPTPLNCTPPCCVLVLTALARWCAADTGPMYLKYNHVLCEAASKPRPGRAAH